MAAPRTVARIMTAEVRYCLPVGEKFHAGVQIQNSFSSVGEKSRTPPVNDSKITVRSDPQAVRLRADSHKEYTMEDRETGPEWAYIFGVIARKSNLLLVHNEEVPRICHSSGWHSAENRVSAVTKLFPRGLRIYDAISFRFPFASLRDFPPQSLCHFRRNVSGSANCGDRFGEISLEQSCKLLSNKRPPKSETNPTFARQTSGGNSAMSFQEA